MLYVITGPFESGKTTQLLRLLTLTKSHGITTSGVICPAVFSKGKKIAIDALLLPGPDLLHLAKLYPDDDVKREMRWDFDPAAMSTINQHLASCTGHVLIIDEIGPQELVYGKGFTSALSLLDKGYYQHAVIVIRPSLLDDAQRRWTPDQIIDVSEEKECAEKLVTKLS